MCARWGFSRCSLTIKLLHSFQFSIFVGGLELTPTPSGLAIRTSRGTRRFRGVFGTMEECFGGRCMSFSDDAASWTAVRTERSARSSCGPPCKIEFQNADAD